MSAPFAERLHERIAALKSRVCVGLDPDLAQLPPECLSPMIGHDPQAPQDSYFERAARCLLAFNQMVLEAVADLAPVVKPQSAYYERYGHWGIWALRQTLEAARERGLLILMDAKRNDIDSTARQYALTYFGEPGHPERAALPADALTLNAYLGRDGVAPFAELARLHGQAIFVLVKTSNRSSGDLQDLALSGEGRGTVAQEMAGCVERWGAEFFPQGAYSGVGAVVGATYPEQIPYWRQAMPRTILLIPGYGAQGAKASDVARAFDAQGGGALINASRSLLYAFQKDRGVTPFQAIRQATQAMRAELNALL